MQRHYYVDAFALMSNVTFTDLKLFQSYWHSKWSHSQVMKIAVVQYIYIDIWYVQLHPEAAVVTRAVELKVTGSILQRL